MYEFDNIISQLEKMNLEYDRLNKIQIYLINNSYIPIRYLVFKKEELNDKDFIFYEEDKSYLINSIEKGNGKLYNPYCQYAKNGGLYYYTFSQMEDIILNYLLYEALEDNEDIENILLFLKKEFGIENYWG